MLLCSGPSCQLSPSVDPRYLMDVVFDEAAVGDLKEEDWWFETEEGTLLKWFGRSK